MYPDLGTLVLWILRSVLDLDLMLIYRLIYSLFDIPQGYCSKIGVEGRFDQGRKNQKNEDIVYRYSILLILKIKVPIVDIGIMRLQR